MKLLTRRRVMILALSAVCVAFFPGLSLYLACPLAFTGSWLIGELVENPESFAEKRDVP